MTVYLGSATFDEVGDLLQIQPAQGFNTVNGMRIANYTVDVLILKNITGENLSDTQYLPPATQMVYPLRNVQSWPLMSGLQLGPDLPSEQVLVEFSDDTDNDFLGTYPYALPLNPDSFASGNQSYNVRVSVSGGVGTLAYNGGGAGTPVLSAANLNMDNLAQRLGATVVNEGTTTIAYSGYGGYAAGAYTNIVPGASLSIGNGSHITVHADYTDNGTIVSIFGEASIV